MRIFTNWPQQAGLMLGESSSIKKGGFSCQWLGNVDMHMTAKCDQNIACGSRVMNISLTANGWTGGRMDGHSDYCKFGNFRENFIFANSVKRHISHVKKLRTWHDLPSSVKDKELSPFLEAFIFAKLRIREVSRK